MYAKKVQKGYRCIMAELKAYGEAVTSIFQLIGNLENDITKSIAWALSSCPVFLKSVVFDILNIEITPQDVQIIYQNFEKDKGITDLEITDNETFYVIIEAKRGWILPGAEQLKLYSEREKILKYNYKYKAIIIMSECSNDYANTYLPFKECNGIAIKHISWKRLYDIASESISVSTNSQKNLLKELKTYLGGIMTMQTQESNWVFIVSLSYSNPTGCNLSFVDIVRLKKIYFHPFGENGWPKEAPNYIAFRYNGKLQSIHHIEGYTITNNLHNKVAEMPDVENEKPYIVYDLGQAIFPVQEVKTGKIYASGRKWAMLDTLFTERTIADACNVSKQRMQK